MANKLEIELLGLPPTVNHMYRTGYRSRFKTLEVREYQQYAVNCLREAWAGRKTLNGRIEMRLVFTTDDKRRWDIDNRVKAIQDYGTHAVNGVSDPVFNIVNTKLRLEKKIENLEKKIRAVENLIDELPIDELETYQMSIILTWRYINHMDTQTVIRVLGLTKTTYYRRKNALIVRAEKYIR